MKVCSICKKEKIKTEFNKRSLAKDGLRSECRVCQSRHNLMVRRSKSGLIAEIIHKQKRNSKKRKMPQPSYTTQELFEWAENQEIFHRLYKDWVLSGYSQKLRPSVDRINDYMPYTISNIQLMTWEDNIKKGSRDIKNGVNKKPLKAVVQMDVHGKDIKEFYSISEAARNLNIRESGIVNCLKGRYETSGGFKWRYH